MIRNVGAIDRIFRIILGTAALIPAVTGSVSGLILAVLVVTGVLTLFSGIYGACPAYHLLKISTVRKITKA